MREKKRERERESQSFKKKDEDEDEDDYHHVSKKFGLRLASARRSALL